MQGLCSPPGGKTVIPTSRVTDTTRHRCIRIAAGVPIAAAHRREKTAAGVVCAPANSRVRIAAGVLIAAPNRRVIITDVLFTTTDRTIVSAYGVPMTQVATTRDRPPPNFPATRN